MRRPAFTYDLDRPFDSNDCDSHLHWMTVEATGDTLEELLDDGSVGVTDWHGNEKPCRSVGELPCRLLALVEEEMADWLIRTESARAEYWNELSFRRDA